MRDSVESIQVAVSSTRTIKQYRWALRDLDAARNEKADRIKLGPCLSERQWGTVREDFGKNGAALHYFIHEQARSRAYR